MVSMNASSPITPWRLVDPSRKGGLLVPAWRQIKRGGEGKVGRGMEAALGGEGMQRRRRRR